MNYKRLDLDNGLRVILVPMKSVKSVTTLVLGNTGSRFETKEQLGIAHFFEHMVFKGTQKYPSPLDIATTLDSVGAQSNAFTSKEYTGYYVKSASKHVELALDVLSQMMFEPLLDDQAIDRERGVIIEEINMYLDQPMHKIGNLFEQMMYRGSGLDHDILGTKESVSRFSSSDFTTFLNQWYGPANLTLIVAGDAEVVNELLLTKIKPLFGQKSTSRCLKRQATFDIANREPKIGVQRLLVQSQKTEQAHLILAWPGIKMTDKRKHALSLLSIILGGNMSSRLFVEVREKRGLGYYVRSDVDTYHHAGSFGASAGVDPKRTHEAIEVIMDQFQQIALGKSPISKSELSRSKDYIAGQISLSLEDSRSVAQWFGMKDILHGKIETPVEVLKKLQSVSLSEVNDLAQTLVKLNQMRLALIGPFEEGDFKKYVGS